MSENGSATEVAETAKDPSFKDGKALNSSPTMDNPTPRGQDPIIEGESGVDAGSTSAKLQAEDIANELNYRVMLEEMEQKYVELKDERDSIRKELEESQRAQQGASNASMEVKKLSSKVEELKSALETTQHRLEESQNETKNVEERSARTLAESDRLREEIT